MSIGITIENISVYLLVFIRIVAVVGFNPILNHSSVPARIRAILALMVTILLAPSVSLPTDIDITGLMYIIAIFKELFIGFILAYVCSIFYLILVTMGEIMDIQFGLSMAKVMDPGTNIQMGVSDKLINFLFLTIFFLTNGHLNLFRLIFTSYDAMPIGVGAINLSEVASYGIHVFTDTFSLAFKFAVPFIVGEFILEIGLGILMKLIPAIHVFVINMQLKIVVALILLFALAQPMAEFIDKYMVYMFEALQSAIGHIS